MIKAAVRIGVSLGLWAWVAGAIAQPVAPAGDPPASVIEVPIEIPLQPLYGAAEKTVPSQVGTWRHWEDRHGVKLRYGAWRGRLGFRANGDTLLMQAHVRYWVQARKKVLGVTIKAGCGVNEPPRQAVIGVLVRLVWRTDWTLSPEFRVLPTRFLDRCEMTAASIDVTPLVEQMFQRQMKDSLRSALATLGPRLKETRHMAQEAWRVLQEPVPLGQGATLMFRPRTIAVAPIMGRDDTLVTRLGVSMAPVVLSVPAQAGGDKRPFPALSLLYPRGGGLRIRLAVDLDYDRISGVISTALRAQPLQVMGRSIDVNQVRISGQGSDIRAVLDLSGGVQGTADVRARAVFDPQAQAMTLRDLSFGLDTTDPSAGMLTDLFHEPVRLALESAANAALNDQMGRWKSQLGASFDGLAGEAMELDLSRLRLQSVDLDMDEDGLRIDATAAGRAVLRVGSPGAPRDTP